MNPLTTLTKIKNRKFLDRRVAIRKSRSFSLGIIHPPKAQFRGVTEQINPEFACRRKKPKRLFEPVDVFQSKSCLAGFEIDKTNFTRCIRLKAGGAESVCHNIVRCFYGQMPASWVIR